MTTKSSKQQAASSQPKDMEEKSKAGHEEEEEEEEAGLHVMMFPWFAFGHISPFLQLARKLSSTGRIRRITFLSAPASVPRLTALLPSSPTIHVHPLEIPAIEGLPAGAESTADITPAMAELLKLAVDLMQPQVAALLDRLRPHLVFHDFVQPWLPSIATPRNIKTLLFSVYSAVSTAYLIVPSRRLHGPSPSLDDLRRPPEGFPVSSSIDSVPAYQAANFLYVFKSFKVGSAPSSVYDRVMSCTEACTAIVFKTCMEMEGQYIKYAESQFGKPMLLAGPVIPEPPSGELVGKWALWLERFPEESVVFCSFGSETFLSGEAVRELVLGLEMTGLPFLAVLNFPSGGGEKALRAELPEGFEERVKGRGVVHTGWVPQQLILGHRSVGCFVCHAGLSSLVEGVVAGCQLVMLPQKGDQYLNAALFSGDLKAGVEVARHPENGSFKREGIYEAVKMVAKEAPGETVRESHRRWREFFMNQGLQDKYMEDFVEKLHALALS